MAVLMVPSASKNAVKEALHHTGLSPAGGSYDSSSIPAFGTTMASSDLSNDPGYGYPAWGFTSGLASLTNLAGAIGLNDPGSPEGNYNPGETEHFSMSPQSLLGAPIVQSNPGGGYIVRGMISSYDDNVATVFSPKMGFYHAQILSILNQ
jgi:hypothetical protein